MDIKVDKTKWTLKNSVHFRYFSFTLEANFYMGFWNERFQNQNHIIRAYVGYLVGRQRILPIGLPMHC